MCECGGGGGGAGQTGWWASGAGLSMGHASRRRWPSQGELAGLGWAAPAIVSSLALSGCLHWFAPAAALRATLLSTTPTLTCTPPPPPLPPPTCLCLTHPALPQASKRVRFGSFPPYLLVQLRRYYVAPDWTPRKMEVLVEVPDRLSLEHLRAQGPQVGGKGVGGCRGGFRVGGGMGCWRGGTTCRGAGT